MTRGMRMMNESSMQVAPYLLSGVTRSPRPQIALPGTEPLTAGSLA
jgi:hypothetical protein